jgi:hypothetical protein
MTAGINLYSATPEKDLFEVLTHGMSSSEDDKVKKLEILEELQRRIKDNSIHDYEEMVRILLAVAKNFGWSRPVSELVSESLLFLTTKDNKYYQNILKGLEGHGKDSAWLFQVFSRIILKLDSLKKKAGIKPLLFFLMNNDSPGDAGTNEVYECLIHLENDNLSKEVVDAVIPFTDSLRFCEIFYSVKLCSKFGNKELLPKMLNIIEKIEIGYFDRPTNEIEQDIFEFLGRIAEIQAIEPLIKILKARANSDKDYSSISAAIGKILDANPNQIEGMLELLYDERKNTKVVSSVLRSLARMEKSKVDPIKLLSNTKIDWKNYTIKDPLKEIMIKAGKSSKPVLFEMIHKDDAIQYAFGLECLKAIGISNEEMQAVFSMPPILQLYSFFYKGQKSIPDDLNQLWKQKSKLGNNLPGSTNLLEHLMFYLFAGFNFVTLNISPLHVEGVDLACFYPETLDIFIIGCTTGVIKDDLAKMDATVKRMKTELPDLFKKTSINPVVDVQRTPLFSPQTGTTQIKTASIFCSARTLISCWKC